MDGPIADGRMFTRRREFDAILVHYADDVHIGTKYYVFWFFI